MAEDRIVKYIQISGIALFYAFVAGVALFLINGIKNGWVYHVSSAPYELSFPFAIIISAIILMVFSVLTLVVSMVFWGFLRDDIVKG